MPPNQGRYPGEDRFRAWLFWTVRIKNSQSDKLLSKMSEQQIFLTLDNDAIVSTPELNLVLEKAKGLSDLEIVICFKNGITRIKNVFIAGLFLLYKERNLRFNLSGAIGDRADLFSDTTHSDELKQYLAHIAFLYGKSDPRWIGGFSYDEKADLTVSRVFAPVLYVDEDTINSIFNSKEGSVFADLKDSFIQYMIDHWANQPEKAYFAKTDEDCITPRLRSHPPVFTFVYFILHSIDQPFIHNVKQPDVAISRINLIWSFTQKYVAGLYELAKNIVRHSSSGKGVISIRAYEPEDTSTDADRIIETFVIDYGTAGIVPTMIDELKKEQTVDLTSKEDEVDLAILNDNYSLQKFFSPGKSCRLSRQFRREMAHLGLLHFMSMIRSNNGSSWISTGAIDAVTCEPKRDTYGDAKLADEQLYEGTNFHFSLPLSRSFSVSKGVVDARLTTTKQALESLTSIYSVKDQITTIRLKDNVHFTDNTVRVEKRVENREDESAFVESIPFDTIKTIFIALDFEGFTFTSTSLLRVLAMISEKTDKMIIVMNVLTDVLSQMLENNELYFQTMDEIEKVPFWIQDRSILVYSKMKDKDFYFADLLYGQSPEVFYSVNAIISNCFPNYVTIASDDHPVDSNNHHYEEAPVSAFFHHSTLRPFDLVLEDSLNMDLFSHNLMTIVEKELL